MVLTLYSVEMKSHLCRPIGQKVEQKDEMYGQNTCILFHFNEFNQIKVGFIVAYKDNIFGKHKHVLLSLKDYHNNHAWL